MTCAFRHENISILYGVEPVPIMELPTRCTCGASLTYASVVGFVRVQPVDLVEMKNEQGEVVMTSTPLETTPKDTDWERGYDHGVREVLSEVRESHPGLAQELRKKYPAWDKAMKKSLGG